jgi:hypothetical protein
MAHDQEVVGFNPITEYWMDVRDIAYINENTPNFRKLSTDTIGCDGSKKVDTCCGRYPSNHIIMDFITANE